MKLTFNIELTGYNNISSLPGGWNSDQYKKLLQALDYDDISETSENDLKELCCMALTDHDPEEAAAIVLKFLLYAILKEGQIDNLSHEMPNEKLWEEYSDLSLHEPLFNAHQLLYDAFQKGFPKAEALRFTVKVSCRNTKDFQVFEEEPEVALLRLLVQGMPENTKIRRLYDEVLLSGSFEDARHIIWQLIATKESDHSLLFEGISSHYWFRDLRDLPEFEGELEFE